MSDEVNPFSPERRYTNNPSEPTPIAPPPPQIRSVWVWVIGGIALMGGVTVICCGVLAFVGIRGGISVMAAPVDAAVEALNEDPSVAEKLGAPIASSSSFGVQEYTNHNGDGGATVNFTATGANDSASVSGRMKLTDGRWSPESLTVDFSDGTEAKIPPPAEVGIGPAERL